MKNLIAFLSLGVCCLLATSTFSQTTFTGAISNDWADAGNWSNGLPAPGNDATIPDGLTVINGGGLYIDFTINNDGEIENDGFIDNFGEIENDGIIVNEGTINNIGAIDNDGEIANIGAIDNDGEIENDGFIINYDTINNDGEIENDGEIANYDTIDNDGEIANYGFIINYDTINNDGEIENDGFIINYDTINQCGIWLGTLPGTNDYTTDNCPVLGCTDTTACNYDDTATMDAGTCIYLEEGECDCEGNVLDECGVCGGTGIPEGDCDCEGNVLDAIGICGGDCISDYNLNGICDSNEVIGCTYEEASNFNANATLDDGSCVYEDCDITIDNQAAFDAGVASVDITSNDQAVYDGAFVDGVASVICPEVDACPMDLDNDNSIGTSDLLELLGAFGTDCLEE